MSAKYTPDSGGTRQFMNSQGVSNAMRAVAEDMAAQAMREGKSLYRVNSRTVQGGWSASNRAGAEVTHADYDYRDRRRGTLVNISRTFRMRGGG